MPLVDILRIDAAIVKSVQEGYTTQEEIADRVGASAGALNIEDAISRLKRADQLDEDSNGLKLGASVELEEVDRKIVEIGPYGTELMDQLAQSACQAQQDPENVIIQDIGVNPTETFIRWYYCEEWRLIKFLMLRERLESAEQTFESIENDPGVRFALHHWTHVYGNAEGYVLSTFKRGIVNELLNTVFLYCEDLGGILCATRTLTQGNPSKFMKRFLYYDSRKVDDLYSNHLPDIVSQNRDNEVRELLSYPKQDDEQFQALPRDSRESFNQEIERSLELFKRTIADIYDFYTKHKESFLQYKHGNKSFFKPLKITPEALERLRGEDEFRTIAYPRKPEDTPLEELDLPEDRLVMDFHEVDIEQLDEIAHKVYWLLVPIINNLVRAYYPNHYGEQLFFLCEEGWRFEGTDRYRVATLKPNQANTEE